MGKLWYSADLGVSLKLRLYGAGVVSVLAYGCECWRLDEAACRRRAGGQELGWGHGTLGG